MLQSKGLWRVGLVLGLLAGVLHLVGYVLYAHGILNGAIHTNIVSWGLWTFGSIVAFVTFQEIAHDWVKSFLNAVCVLGMFVIFGLILYQRGRDHVPFELDAGMITDLLIAVLDLFVMFIWILFRKRSLSVIDFWLQVDIIISFLPIMRSTIADPSSETLIPWVLWTFAYLAQYFCIACRAADKVGDEVDLKSTKRSLNTPLNYLFWHGALAFVLLQGGAALL
ncbi:MAG TPA: hypothetical protein VEB18_03775 [Candidatus Paceibacterota bacterium]|nr:hypothetical protein [Candidatus Paceibacterota bacterium]